MTRRYVKRAARNPSTTFLHIPEKRKGEDNGNILNLGTVVLSGLSFAGKIEGVFELSLGVF